MRWFFAVVAFIVLVAVGSAYVASRHGADPASAYETGYSGQEGLAERINHACRRGYEVYDWAFYSTADSPPEGAAPPPVVQVICSEISPGKDGYTDSYPTAVER